MNSPYLHLLCCARRRRCDESPRGRATSRAWSWMGEVTISGSEIRMPMGRTRSKKYSTRWWQLKYVSCSPRSLVKRSNLTSIVFKGVQPVQIFRNTPNFRKNWASQNVCRSFFKNVSTSFRLFANEKVVVFVELFQLFWGFCLIWVILHVFLLVVGTQIDLKKVSRFLGGKIWHRGDSLAGILGPPTPEWCSLNPPRLLDRFLTHRKDRVCPQPGPEDV